MSDTTIGSNNNITDVDAGGYVARWLLTITGHDKPGVTTAICRLLDEEGADLLDIQQVTIPPLLVMALDVGLPKRDASLPRKEQQALLHKLERLAVELNLTINLQPFDPAHVTNSDNLYAVTCLAPIITPHALQAITGVLAQMGANITRISRLTEHQLKAIELTVYAPCGVEQAQLKKALFAVSNAVQVDIAVQPESLYRRSKRLIVMDVDSTLIQNEVIDEIAKIAGVEQEVADITREAMEGKLDFAGALHKRVALLAGLPADRLQEVFEVIRFTPGAERLIKVLKLLGYKTAIVSGGFNFVTDILKERLRLDYAFANTLEIENGKLTGRVTGAIVDRQAKARLLKEVAAKEEIELAQTLAVGDGANDLLMLETAGVGVAFNAKPIVREAADLSINQPSLDVLLYLIGIHEHEIARFG
jgi:phosphoserine phosphatase